MRRWLRVIIDTVALGLVAVLLALALAPGPEEAPSAADLREGDGLAAHILENGTEETGAFNLVTAIYLGYRAYDTLGETVVLLLAVSGIMYLVGSKR
jgi:multicomponent Na+:H+ antiporter subunit B